MSAIEVFLDETPGETRAVIARDGRWDRILIERDDDRPEHRLGARLVGRVADLVPGAGGAFVDLGAGEPFGFLAVGKAAVLAQGQAVEVEVTAEPRGDKGPTLRRLGPAEGDPRILVPGPSIADRLAVLAPDVPPVTGAEAIRAVWEAEEEALAAAQAFPEQGLDLSVERTRALIAVDIDHTAAPGRDARRARREANRHGLDQGARLIRLKAWGGLLAIDLIGVGHDGEEIGRWARAAFDGPGVAFGPVNRFGVLQLSLPWGSRPIEERLLGADGRRPLTTRAIDLTRRLRHALLTDTASPRLQARCAPEEAEAAAPLVARLGPRAAVTADPTVRPGKAVVEAPR
ncbi:RNA-binding protein [Brevundimonas lutea]|uniref:RNA-binding protein n=1 Tax=Brevundimonas lutea TaxID=2293980 RepID=UPI000F039F8B|nr:RNA-binding protein [Brevundimonas lutea]